MIFLFTLIYYQMIHHHHMVIHNGHFYHGIEYIYIYFNKKYWNPTNATESEKLLYDETFLGGNGDATSHKTDRSLSSVVSPSIAIADENGNWVCYNFIFAFSCLFLV